MNKSDQKKLRIAVIGYGFRIRHLIGIMQNYDSNFEIAAICDKNLDQARYHASQQNLDITRVNFCSDPQLAMDSDIDAVMIGTNCSSHAELAVKALNRDLSIFLEKPVAISLEQLNLLQMAYAQSKSKVVVSFPLRLSPWVSEVKKIIDAGVIGPVSQVQAVNNVPYGHVYFQAWYRSNKETGGLFLQKATHDFDYLNYLVGEKPVTICAMTSKKVYTGSHTPGLFCEVCNEKKVCKESPYNVSYVPADGEWMRPDQYMCAFASDADNEDCGSAIIEFENGIHAVYSQNFFSKHKAAKRGARLIGYDGSVEFDWYSNDIRIFKHHSPIEERVVIDTEYVNAHGGGDYKLVQNFLGVARGQNDSICTLEEGILSTLMCLKAKESSLKKIFCKIKMHI